MRGRIMATLEQDLALNEGIITQIIGPVVDVEFPHGNLPEIYNALK